MVKIPTPPADAEPAPAAKKAPAKKAPAKKAPAPRKRPANRPDAPAKGTKLSERPAPAVKVPPKVETHSLTDADEKLRVCYYGPPGAGKTTAALRAADGGHVVVIDAERGLKARALRRAGVNIDNIEVYDGEISYEALEQLYFQLKRRMADGEQIHAIVWDSLTMTLPWLVEIAVAAGVVKAHAANKARSDFDVYVEDYGTMTEQMKRLLTRRFMDLDCHLIVTCLAKRDKDENGAVRISPDVTPALGQTLAGAMDMVLAMRSELLDDGEVARDAITTAMGRYEAKDRFGVLPHVLNDPSFDRVLAYSEGELSQDEDELQGGASVSSPSRWDEDDEDDEDDEGADE